MEDRQAAAAAAAAAALESRCIGFVPQQWRRKVCKNCLRTKNSHCRSFTGSSVKEEPETVFHSSSDSEEDLDAILERVECRDEEFVAKSKVNTEQRGRSQKPERDPSPQIDPIARTPPLKSLLLYFTDPESEDPGPGPRGLPGEEEEEGAFSSPSPAAPTVPRQRGRIGSSFSSRSLDDCGTLERRGMDGGRRPGSGGGGVDDDDDDGMVVVEGNNSNLVVNNLREKVFALDDRCDRLEREKAALADLLATKRRDAELARERYSDRIRNLEDESQMLKTEKMRLVDRLKLPDKERRSLLLHENELSELRRKLEEEEGHCADMVEENLGLKQEVRDLHLEMEELHDQFREDEAIEFRELQKELESTAKSCRILQFKLRKAERRIDQLETERIQADEKAARQQGPEAVRFQQRPDERQYVVELEEELRAAKHLNARLHDQVDAVEEKRIRYEQELDRVNDILTESETRRQVLHVELERLREQVSGAIQHDTSGKGTKAAALQLPKATEAPARQRSGQEADFARVMRDMGDSLERENDLREQLKFAEEEAVVMRKKARDLEEENEGLNAQLHQLSTKKELAESEANLAKQNAELTNRLRDLEAENGALRASVGQLDERTTRLTKEVVRAKFSSGQSLSESPTEWGEMRTQVQSLENECRGLRRKVVDLEASNAKTKTELEQQRKQGGAETRRKELEMQTKDDLKRRVIQLETETVGLAAMVKNREDDNERLEEEISESREAMNRMLESFRRRETELRDDVDAARHKNATLADLLELVNERAESTQRELDRHRKEGGGPGPGGGGGGGKATAAATGCDDTLHGRSKTPDAKDSQKRIEALERLLAEETRKVLTVEKKLRLSDSAALETQDDNRLRQHEKEILLQELALCQKQLIGANDQIADLKGRLLAMKESHEDVKEDFAKVSKELEKVRKGVSQQPVTVKGKPEREPASWRWEKQEMERQLKEHKKKLDDVYSEMKRHQLKWKAAGEDVERENKIKEELEKKIGKLKEDYDCCNKESEELRNKVEELEELLRRRDRQWEKERNLLEAEKMAAENDARQKDELIRSKDVLIAQKNDLIAEKDRVLADRDEALQQRDALVQQRDTELEFRDQDARIKTEEIRQFRSELGEFRAHLAEKDERIRQLDDHVRRRDDRLREKDEILQQINRKLVEKGNQVGDMDKTIRQVIRKLQARDCDLAMSGAELRRVQADLKSAQDRLQVERKTGPERPTEEAEAWKTSVARLESELERAVEEKKRLSDEARETVEVRLELNQALEKLHVRELTSTMNQTDAFKTMMREKEGLIADKFRLTDEVNRLRKDIATSSDQWKREKEDLQKLLAEKTKQLDYLKSKELQKPGSRPSTLTISPKSADDSSEVDPSSSSSSSSADVICGLRAKLDRQESLWTAEKATLEEFYEVNSRTLQETVCQLRDACHALRLENDGQLQLLQSSRRALSDLRNRYDLGVASWNEERERLLVSTGQVERYRRQASDLEASLESVRLQLLRAETKCREVENRLMVEENAWKTEKAALEAARKISEDDNKPPATRVSEFRARFEKFGSSKSKKGEEEGRRAEREAQDVCRELQKQLKELENQREKERKNLVERLEKQREEYEGEIHQIRERNAMLEKKAKELSQLQRSVVDIQYRLVEDRNQWQLERAQLQRRLEEALQQYTTQKENISQLLAEIKKLRILASGLAEQKGGEAKLRSRSLTPSAEKMRVTALTLYSARKVTADDKRASATSGQNNITREENEKRGIDQPIINDLVQAIEETSRLADDLGKARNSKDQHQTASPGRSLGEGRGGGGGGEFKRSHSSAEVTPSFTSGQILPSVTATGSCWSRTGNPAPPTYSIYATTRRPGRQGHLSRSASEDEDSGDRRGPSADPGPTSGFRPPASNRGSMYASGTQSAYGSRDPSPDKVGQGQGQGLRGGGGGLRKISPYPAAPPSMIITPLHTPRREHSIDRDEDLLTSDNIRRLYAKLDVIGRQNASDVISATGGEGGGGGEEVGGTAGAARQQKVVTMVKSASMDAVESDFSTAETRTSNTSYTAAAAAGGYAISSRPQIIPGAGTSVTAATSGRVTSSNAATKKHDKRSASVSPRTARRRFYEDYPYDPRNTASPPVTSSASGSLVAKGATHSSAALYDARCEEEEAAPSASSSFQVCGAEDKAKTSSGSPLKQFFQNVKDKRKLFGGRRSASVDSSQTHVSIARIGANVLSEPAAPSTYQPPEMTVQGQRRNSRKDQVRSGSVDSTLNDASSGASSKEKEKSTRR